MPWFNDEDEKPYVAPAKPEGLVEQVAMIWEAIFNGGSLLSRMYKLERAVSRRLKWHDTKLNFILVLLALILAMLGCIISQVF